MRPASMDDFVQVDHGNRQSIGVNLPISGLTPTSANLTIEDGGTPTTIPGSITTQPYDLIPVQLTADTTYSFAYRPTEVGGIEDPYLGLFNPDLSTVLAEDDDGGLGRSSMITFTPTESGTYYLFATSWYHIDPTAPGYPDYRDVGGYTLSTWSSDAATDAPDTTTGAVAIGLGTTFGHLDTAGDRDMYKVELTPGLFYNFTYAGGLTGAGDYPNEAPGESIGVLRLYDANGVEISAAVNFETGLGFMAQEA